MNLPKNVNTLYNLFKANGFNSWIVGGCVRDFFLNKRAKDWDMCCDASAEEIKNLYDKNNIGFYPLGYEFGTVVAVFEDGEKIEVQSLSGKPVEENLKSRDFTVNAMAYSIENDEIIDLFGGASDCENKILRTVTDSEVYFSNNPFAILRAVRLSLELDFLIEDKTYNAMKRNMYLIDNIPMSRVKRELCKLIEYGMNDKIITEQSGEAL